MTFYKKEMILHDTVTLRITAFSISKSFSLENM